MKLYKVFRADGRTLHDRDPWPTREWMPAVGGALVPCKNGYHLCRVRDLPVWLPPPGGRVYEAVVQGEVMEADDKVVARQARLGRLVGTMTHPALVLWAADCAARRPQGRAGEAAIRAARAWARHPCERHRVSAADAANATAAYAASAYASAATANAASADAAYAAASAYASAANAYAAASAAANAYAASAAASAAEREWQGRRLLWYLERRAR